LAEADISARVAPLLFMSTRTKATAAIDKFSTRVESADVLTAQAHIEQISSVAQQAATRIDTAFADKSTGMRALLELTARTSSAVEGFIQRLETSKLPTEELETRLKSFTSKLDSLLERFGATVTTVEQRMTAQNGRQHWWGRS
jgi:phage shock protein A